MTTSENVTAAARQKWSLSHFQLYAVEEREIISPYHHYRHLLSLYVFPLNAPATHDYCFCVVDSGC